MSVIDIKGKKRAKETKTLVDSSDQIDRIVKGLLLKGTDLKIIAGLLGHRLGTLIAASDDPDRLLDVICNVIIDRVNTLKNFKD